MSRSEKVRDRLSILVGIGTEHSSSADGNFGELFTRTFSVTEGNLNWKLKAKTVAAALAEAGNIYLFIYYVCVGTNLF